MTTRLGLEVSCPYVSFRHGPKDLDIHVAERPASPHDVNQNAPHADRRKKVSRSVTRERDIRKTLSRSQRSKSSMRLYAASPNKSHRHPFRAIQAAYSRTDVRRSIGMRIGEEKTAVEYVEGLPLKP